jgi:hypothetical protein
VTLNAPEFVNALSETCRDAAVSDTMATLNKPSGRKVPEHLKSLSAWFNSQTPEQQNYISAVAAMAADRTLFGVFCVLDGVRAVEQTSAKSSFRLSCSKGSVTTVLSPGAELLHNIYRSHP